MARPKKSANKKATKKTARGKTKPAAKTASKKAKTAKQSTGLKQLAIRRPSPNPQPDISVINEITHDLLTVINGLDANLRALDRVRHNGVGLKRQGFIEAAFRLSTKFPQYFPHWLDTEKFQADLNLFNAIRSLVEVCRSLEEKAWNINVESADMIYTNALEYYAQVQDACPKARGFWARSLRYAQTPHIIRGVLPKAKLLSYPA